MSSIAASTLISSASKLSRQRQAAAAARAHANVFQLKVAVVCSCVLVGGLGFALHRASLGSASADVVPESVHIATGSIEAAAARTGQIEVPYSGDTCRRLHFNNQTGAYVAENLVTCAPFEIRPSSEPGVSRTDAIMSAFRLSR
jgi:hypothetical protein